MSRWLIKADINKSNEIDNNSNKSLEDNQVMEALPTGELGNGTFEGNENKWKEEQEKNKVQINAK